MGGKQDMTLQQEIMVRRAKPGDAGKIVAFVNTAWGGRRRIDDAAAIERFGSVGFLIAERDAEIIGMLGWQVENLVVGLTDLLIGSNADSMVVAEALLAEMEQAADELQCEVSLVFLPRPAPAALTEFCGFLGYESHTVAGLPAAWREAAYAGGFQDDDAIMVKKLREQQVFRPM
jgi:N-acetylglutamate synthase-like GNAT family acetyltransferase